MVAQATAIFCVVDDLLNALRWQEDCRRQTSNAEVITTALAATFSLAATKKARAALHEKGLIPLMLVLSRFRGEHQLQQAFLRHPGVTWMEPWTWQYIQAAHKLWVDHVRKKSARHTAKRPVADVVNEAFTLHFHGLITHDPGHFTAVSTLVP